MVLRRECGGIPSSLSLRKVRARGTVARYRDPPTEISSLRPCLCRTGEKNWRSGLCSRLTSIFSPHSWRLYPLDQPPGHEKPNMEPNPPCPCPGGRYTF